MYNDELARWIPVLFTWMYGIGEPHYRAHFTSLLQSIQDSSLTPTAKDLLVRQVVDFSMAQKNGFINAYLNVFETTDRSVALSKLKGCQEHFRQAITRIKRNRAVIPAGSEVSMTARFHHLAFKIKSIFNRVQIH